MSMLFLLFQLGNDRYALEASRVVEVVPMLELNQLNDFGSRQESLFVVPRLRGFRSFRPSAASQQFPTP